jgi:GNAT superfamily N-acetyltransferase
VPATVVLPASGSRHPGEHPCVAPDHQHCGVGAAFLGQAEQIAKSAGLDEVRLFTNETMTENLAYDPTKGYTESHRSIDRGYRRVWFVKTP